MGWIKELFGYKKRRQMIAWLILEGWEPKIQYRRKNSQYPSLVREDYYIQGEGFDVREVKYCDVPFIDTSWNVFPFDELEHYVIVAEWLKSKRR